MGYDYGKLISEARNICFYQQWVLACTRAYNYMRDDIRNRIRMPDELANWISVSSINPNASARPSLRFSASSHVKKTSVIDWGPSRTYSLLRAGVGSNSYQATQMQPTTPCGGLSQSWFSRNSFNTGFAHTKTSFTATVRRRSLIHLRSQKRRTRADLACGGESDSGGSLGRTRNQFRGSDLTKHKILHIAKHLLKRGIRAVPKRLLTRAEATRDRAP